MGNEQILAASRQIPALEKALPLSRQLRLMSGALKGSGHFRRALGLIGGIIVVILATAYGQIVLNQWNIPFYNAIENRDLQGFLDQLKVFSGIAGALLLLNVSQTWLDKYLSLSVREGISRDLIRQWMKDRRAVRLSEAGLIGVNPDQRLQEDARVLAEMTTSLSIGIVQAGIQLASFIGVLWVVSSDFALTFQGKTYALPGYMVWAALLYSSTASFLIWLVGRRLVGLNAQRYAREADYRTSLMRTSEHLVAIALARAEPREERWIESRFDRLVATLRDIIRAQIGLKWVSSSYGWLSQVVPIIIASPMYFSGKISFGGLMMAVSAFNHVIAALRWYMDNFSSIAIWRATLLRVSAFRLALEELDVVIDDNSALARETDRTGRIVLEKLETHPSGEGASEVTGARIAAGNVVIEPGERVLFNGDGAANHRSLFLALAGLSSSASGKITLPPSQEVLFLQSDAYLPEGRLKDVLSYPDRPKRTQTQAMMAALKAVGLQRLTGNLDQEARWHRILEEDDRARLLFANVLVRQPRCLVMEDIMDGLEEETARSLVDALIDSGQRTILYFGHSAVFIEMAAPRLVRIEPVGQAAQAAG